MRAMGERGGSRSGGAGGGGVRLDGQEGGRTRELFNAFALNSDEEDESDDEARTEDPGPRKSVQRKRASIEMHEGPFVRLLSLSFSHSSFPCTDASPFPVAARCRSRSSRRPFPPSGLFLCCHPHRRTLPPRRRRAPYPRRARTTSEAGVLGLRKRTVSSAGRRRSSSSTRLRRVGAESIILFQPFLRFLLFLLPSFSSRGSRVGVRGRRHSFADTREGKEKKKERKRG
jgi:hypothetical protein